MVGGRATDTQAASTSEMARFETETLSTTANLKHLMEPLREVDRPGPQRASRWERSVCGPAISSRGGLVASRGMLCQGKMLTRRTRLI